MEKIRVNELDSMKDLLQRPVREQEVSVKTVHNSSNKLAGEIMFTLIIFSLHLMHNMHILNLMYEIKKKVNPPRLNALSTRRKSKYEVPEI